MLTVDPGSLIVWWWWCTAAAAVCLGHGTGPKQQKWPYDPWASAGGVCPWPWAGPGQGCVPEQDDLRCAVWLGHPRVIQGVGPWMLVQATLRQNC